MFHRALALYEPGDRILPGNWGRLIAGIGPAHTSYFREYLLERIRQAEFSALPSRMRSVFAFETFGAAEMFAHQPGQPIYTYRVEIANPEASRHRADITWLDILNIYRTFDGAEEWARHYWRGDEREPGRWEVLAESELVVLERLTPVVTNGH
jgi:hypothetical protein